jgi:hypothetical protein
VGIGLDFPGNLLTWEGRDHLRPAVSRSVNRAEGAGLPEFFAREEPSSRHFPV